MDYLEKVEKVKKLTCRLLGGKISDWAADLLRCSLSYLILVGGTWFLLNLAAFLFNPSNGFFSMFNQTEAFLYSVLTLLALFIRQRVGEYLSARMNTIIAEILALMLAVLLFAGIFSGHISDFKGRSVISILEVAVVRYIPLQAYFDRGITRKSRGLYEMYAGVRRANWIPVLMSFVIFYEFTINRSPSVSKGLLVGVIVDLITALITAEVIRRRIKARRIPAENFSAAKSLVLDIDLAELNANAFVHSKEIRKARAAVGNMFNSSGYGFSGNTLIINLDTYTFCKNNIPEMQNRNVLIHIRNNIEKYGLHAADKLEKIASVFIAKGFVVYFHTPADNKSEAQQSFEEKMSGNCVLLNKNYCASLETVINSSGGYNQKCANHISELFAQAYSATASGSALCKTVNAQIKELLAEYSLLDMFYELIQTVELCVHLTCLCALAEDVKCNRGEIEQLSLGRMVDITGNCLSNRKTDDENLKEAVRFIEALCNIKGGGKVSSARVFQTAVSLRNRYLGHGTMTYSVSEELVYYLTDICAYIVNVCCELLTGRFAQVNLTAEKVPFTDVSSAVEVENQLYYYSCFFGNGKAEYINPLNGQFYQNCSRRVISTRMNTDGGRRGADNA